MPNSIYTEMKNAKLDERIDKEKDRNQLFKASKQAEIAGDKDTAAELEEEVDVLDRDLIATAAADQKVVDTATLAEVMDGMLAPGKPNPNAGKRGYTANGQVKP